MIFPYRYILHCRVPFAPSFTETASGGMILQSLGKYRPASRVTAEIFSDPSDIDTYLTILVREYNETTSL